MIVPNSLLAESAFAYTKGHTVKTFDYNRLA